MVANDLGVGLTSVPFLSPSTFTANNGSALLLRQSLAYLEGDLLFENNTANLGAAVSVRDRSRVREAANIAVFMGCTSHD